MREHGLRRGKREGAPVNATSSVTSSAANAGAAAACSSGSESNSRSASTRPASAPSKTSTPHSSPPLVARCRRFAIRAPGSSSNTSYSPASEIERRDAAEARIGRLQLLRELEEHGAVRMLGHLAQADPGVRQVEILAARERVAQRRQRGRRRRGSAARARTSRTCADRASRLGRGYKLRRGAHGLRAGGEAPRRGLLREDPRRRELAVLPRLGADPGDPLRALPARRTPGVDRLARSSVGERSTASSHARGGRRVASGRARLVIRMSGFSPPLSALATPPRRDLVARAEARAGTRVTRELQSSFASGWRGRLALPIVRDGCSGARPSRSSLRDDGRLGVRADCVAGVRPMPSPEFPAALAALSEGLAVPGDSYQDVRRKFAPAHGHDPGPDIAVEPATRRRRRRRVGGEEGRARVRAHDLLRARRRLRLVPCADLHVLRGVARARDRRARLRGGLPARARAPLPGRARGLRRRLARPRRERASRPSAPPSSATRAAAASPSRRCSRLRDARRRSCPPAPSTHCGWFDLEVSGDSALHPVGDDPFVNAEWIRQRGRDYLGPAGEPARSARLADPRRPRGPAAAAAPDRPDGHAARRRRAPRRARAAAPAARSRSRSGPA